ncbi:hypothetical protein [Brachyspira sp. G79]|uniref:hypothetical protein n=1 Tax=Brachyspira sp. G79 TaxID=1358104 RepID=UPI000BBB93FE|nr:hypothetical protein [Brachyspira sp. G79]PCG20197.1 hypothetical protein KQ44_09360 [Brachyspira sp. G79]
MKKMVIKIILSLTAVIFAVSCGNSANSSTNPDTDYPTDNYFYVAENSYTLGYEHDIIEVDTDASYSQVKKQAAYKFSITPSDASCSVTIANITIKGTGTITDVNLSASDLSVPSYIKNGEEISVSLTSTGVNKFKASPKTQKAVYTVTLEFKNGESTKNVDIDLTVIPVKIITKEEIENMINTLGTSGTVTVIDGIIPRAEFNFSTFSLTSSGSSFTATSEYIYTNQQFSASSVKYDLQSQIEKSSSFKTLAGLTLDYNSVTTSITGANKNLAITFKFGLKTGYALDSSSSFITTSGMKITLILKNNTWK